MKPITSEMRLAKRADKIVDLENFSDSRTITEPQITGQGQCLKGTRSQLQMDTRLLKKITRGHVTGFGLGSGPKSIIKEELLFGLQQKKC